MIEGRWMPQTEEEWTLLEDLHIVTRLAAEEGVSKARMASLLSFMASATSQQAAFEQTHSRPAESRQREHAVEGETLAEAMGESEEAKPDGPVCPHCDEELTEIGGAIGEPECPECGEAIGDDVVNEVMDSGK